MKVRWEDGWVKIFGIIWDLGSFTNGVGCEMGFEPSQETRKMG